MAAITITDLNNAKLDVDHIAEVATSLNDTSTDRLGNIKSTVKAAVDSLRAFNSRGAWVTATTYAVKDLVSNGGVWYACVTAHISSAAFATDVDTKWRVHQGITAGELSDPSGAAQVNTIQTGLDALLRSIQDKLREFASVADYPSLDAAFAEHDTVFIPAGVTVTLTANWQPPRDGLRLYGYGKTSRIVFSGNNRRIHLVVNDFTLENLLIDGQKPTVGWETTNNTDYGIRVGEAVGAPVTGLRVRNVTFKDIGMDGILLANCADVIIDDDCEFINCRRWGVAGVASTYGINNVYIGGYYDTDFGGGPVGKEFPYGTIDVEPDTGDAVSNNIRYGNIVTNKGMLSVATFDSAITNTSITDARLINAELHVINTDANIRNAMFIGADAYFKADTNADGLPTTASHLDMTFATGRNPVLTTTGKRANLIPADYGDSRLMSLVPSVSGTGSSAGYVNRNIDGIDVPLLSMSLGAATGVYVMRHAIDATITSGDQVIIVIEVERTDANTATGNFFSMQLGPSGSLKDRLLLPAAGISRLCVAFKADSTVANPQFNFGLSGTPGVAVTVLVRKVFVFVNPLKISPEMLRIAPVNMIGEYTGTATGLTTSPTGAVKFSRVGDQVTLTIPSTSFNGTSNAATYTITGMPTWLRPAAAKVCMARSMDNGVPLTTPSAVSVETTGVLAFNTNMAGGAYTSSGTKGLFNTTISYSVS